MPLVTRQANQGNLFSQATEPTDWQNGNIWIDTDNANVFVNRSGTAVQIGVGTLGTALQILRADSGATALEFAAPPVNVSQATDFPASPTSGDLFKHRSIPGIGQFYGETSGEFPDTWLKLGSSGILFLVDDFQEYTTQAAADTEWASSNTPDLRVDITNNELDIQDPADGAFGSVTLDLGGALSDTLWVIRFELEITDLTNRTSTGAGQLNIGMFSVDENSEADISQDFIGYRLNDDVSATQLIEDRDGAAVNTGTADATFTDIPTVETVFIEMKRTSATAYSVEIFSDSTFATSVEAQTGTVTSTTVGLQFFGVKHGNSNDATANVTAQIRNVRIKNGVSTF